MATRISTNDTSTKTLLTTSVLSIQRQDALPPEPESEYEEQRKNIIFKKLNIDEHENALLQFLKQSQLKVNEKSKKCIKGGFFQSLPMTIYNLSISLKENIANYCLIFSLYFKEGEIIKALKLFLLMCEQNKNSLIYLTNKIIDQLPKISNTNKIAKFYPTITKTMLQLLSVFIKLSGKFNKSTLENFYIILYYKIIHVLSITVIKYNPGNSDEINNQLKNERRYFYSSCLFDSSIYLFNRFQPLSVCINILQHILDLYGNKLTFVPNEIESILLLKVNYNLGIFYFIDGYNTESITNLNQARERLLEIKYFPTTPLKKYKPSEKSEISSSTNSSSNLYNFNEYLAAFNRNVKFNRNNNYKRTSVNQYPNFLNEKNNDNQQSLIAKIKEKNLKTQREYELKRNLKIRQFKQISTIYLGVNSLLSLGSPILLEQVKEKILIEIELLLSEIELNHKNYREALNHINLILALQSIGINDNPETTFEAMNFRQSHINKKKMENNFYDIMSKFKTFKYRLSSIDKKRILLILNQIEAQSNNNEINISDKKMEIKYNRNLPKRNEFINKDRKIITSKEMEKFFLFICGLSIYQLKILNESQPEPSLRRNDLPIIFSNQFQDCLTNAQRMALSFLETMSLSRYIILKDTNKDIAPDNLDYRFMKYRIKESDSDEENSNKIRNKGFRIDINKGKRRSSDSNMSVNTQNNIFSSKKMILKKLNEEKEEDDEKRKDIELLLKIIKNEENTNFINLHANSILKLLNQMNKEELKVFIKSPQLLNKLIREISNKFEIKENGGISDTKNFFYENK